MSIQQSIASDVYQMAGNAQTPEQIRSLQQHLTQSVQNGVVPSYVGIPLLQSLNDRFRQVSMMNAPQPPQEPPIAQQVLQQAQGIDQAPPPQQAPQGLNTLQSNLPVEGMYDGGIVALADGGDVDEEDDDDERNAESEYMQALAQVQDTADNSAQTVSGGINRTPNVEQGITGLKGKEFYNSIYDTLLSQAKEMGVKNPEAIARLGAAQSALETGYGKSTAGGNNYFGIKGAGNKQRTQEFNPASGRLEGTTDSFRKYGSMGESAADYINFLHSNPRYAKVLNAESPEQAIALQGRTGYATDPDYGKKLNSIHRSNMGIASLAQGGEVKHFQTGDPVIDRFASDYTNNANENSYGQQKPGSIPIGEAFSNYGQKIKKFFNSNKDNVPDNLRAYSDNGMFSNMPSESAGQRLAISPQESPLESQRPSFSEKETDAGYGDAENYRLSLNKPQAPAAYNPFTQSKSDATRSEPAARSEPFSVSGASNESPRQPQRTAYDDFMDELRQDRQAIKQQKEEDKYMSLLTAGLGMMGGTSPYGMTNIGQGAMAGVANYTQSSRQRAAELAALNKGMVSAQRYKELGDISRQNQMSNEAYRKESLGLRGRELDINEEGKVENVRIRQEEANRRSDADIQSGLLRLQSDVEKNVDKTWEIKKFTDPKGYEAAKADAISKNPQIKMFNDILNARFKDRYKDQYPGLFAEPTAQSSGSTIRFDASGKIIK